jgi:pimeloyl-ACP methyl ester carboxylesterase
MKRINRQLFVAFLIFTFTISPLSFSNITELLRVDASQDITGYQEWNQDLAIDSNVTVLAGATLVINKGVHISFTQKWLNLNVYGTLIIKGTPSAPVTLSGVDKDNFAIITRQDSTTIISNANIVNGGYTAFQVKALTNTATASGYKGALQVDGGNVKVRNTIFKNSSNAVLVSTDVANVHINYSKFIDNGFDVDAPNGTDFKYNWWGQSTGPIQICNTYPSGEQCYYEKIYGDFDFSNWLPQPDFHDPVIIIPGIFGSAEEGGQLQLDPVFHTYDNLYAEFANNGYVPDKDLFIFPYEWRDSNIENAKKLKSKIDEIKSITSWPRVDVLAHSMGGLLAREYIESGYYGNDVDQLITLATPNLGAPETYMKWEGDGWFWSPVDIYMNHIVKQEAKENGFADTFDYIHNRPIASLQELLPTYSYLYEADNGKNLRVYPNDYPRNEFLENLNANSSKLSSVEYNKIVGNLQDNESTVSGINVVNADMGKYWIHGYPLGFEIPGTDRGTIKSSGDGVIPFDSAKSVDIKSDNLIELPSDHRSIVTDAQKDVLELLTGTRPTTEVKNSIIKNMFMAQVFSPIDIQIVAPDGKRVGKDFATGKILNEIDGAYYTGYTTKNEFVTIPNPIKGIYKILTEGIGDGAYTIETTEMDQNARGVAGQVINTIEGIAVVGQKEEKTVEVKGVEIIDNVDTVAPEARMFFDTKTNLIVVEGVDENPTTVAYFTAPKFKKNQKQKDKITTATITDQAGNVTILKYTEKFVNHNRRVAVELNSISYNGVVTNLYDTIAKYNWTLGRKDEIYRMFATNLHTASSTVESHYRPKQNITMIMTRPQELDDNRDDDNDADRRATKQKLAGLVIPALVTKQGVIEIKY